MVRVCSVESVETHVSKHKMLFKRLSETVEMKNKTIKIIYASIIKSAKPEDNASL